MKLYNKLMIAGGILVLIGFIVILDAISASVKLGLIFCLVGIVVGVAGWLNYELTDRWAQSKASEDAFQRIVDNEKLYKN